MAIIKPQNLDFGEKKLAAIIAGQPGIGKTTLALSASRPLLIDLDGGVSRVEARYRKDVEAASTYEELVSDLKDSDLSAYDTIVIDTGGKLFEFLKPVVIAEDRKNGKRDGSLSLQGYGACKRKFADFISFVKRLGKDLIVVFHATEAKLEDDTVGLRIRIEGATRDEIWDDMDIGGFMEMVGNKRTIGFSNCDRYYAKGTHGIRGVWQIPDLSAGGANDFMAKLFAQIRENLAKEQREYAEYAKAVEEWKGRFEANVKDAESANAMLAELSKATLPSTAKPELWHALKAKSEALGLHYNETAKAFE